MRRERRRERPAWTVDACRTFSKGNKTTVRFHTRKQAISFRGPSEVGCVSRSFVMSSPDRVVRGCTTRSGRGGKDFNRMKQNLFDPEARRRRTGHPSFILRLHSTQRTEGENDMWVRSSSFSSTPCHDGCTSK